MDKYQLTLIDKKDKKQVYEGEVKKVGLVVEANDPETRSTNLISRRLHPP